MPPILDSTTPMVQILEPYSEPISFFYTDPIVIWSRKVDQLFFIRPGVWEVNEPAFQRSWEHL